jgi:hypothetical protein
MEQLFTKEGKVFLNRQKEIEVVDEKLKKLTKERSVESEPPLHAVLYFYGVGRLGKTSLIDQIEIKAKKIENVKPSVVSINFDNNGRYKNQSGKNNILKEIISQLNIEFEFSESDLDSGDELIGVRLINQLKKTNYAHPIVLLFDTLENASPDNFKWLQEQLVVPLLNEWQILIAYAGRKKSLESQLYFPWDIKRHLKYFPLERFTEKQTRDHIGKLLKDKSKAIPKDIMELTGGIPGLNEKMADLIVANPELGDQVYLQRIVDETIFIGGSDKLAYKKDLMYMSVCRQFENRLLDHLIENLAWRRYDEEVRSGTALIQRLLETTLLENYPDGYGYVFAINYRRIVDRHFRSINRKDHLRVHVSCYQWYENEVNKGDWVALADQIYHLVGAWYDLSQHSGFDDELINKFPDTKNRRVVLKNLLRSVLNKLANNNRGFTIVNKLKWILEGEEFSWFMPQAEIDELQKLCDNFIEDIDNK